MVLYERFINGGPGSDLKNAMPPGSRFFQKKKRAMNRKTARFVTPQRVPEILGMRAKADN
jgi:hypothetical protein